ncbi:DUF4374 domain-containing protein [Pedobacter endophyticus]|uniref:DUF4374 domain-containing protein n=1 Tax=Pedobacter endophyticus TaxID=2789740 RepID=A0A7S9PZ69_9SPHI|nr:DUF4374 domain-containing protein [Pedobacter endophyticus]QPH39322.1 DUF4374 domain-containing protein [Pedobacter endophyticus]
MKVNFTSAFVALALATTIVSCSKKSDNPVSENPGNYILTVTPVASTAVADYLLTANNLESGTISTAGNGVEQDGTYRYYVTHNNKFFSMLYGQGNPGAVTTYNILGGKLNKISNFQTETVQTFAPVNDDLLLVKLPRTINATGATNATWYQVNTNSLLIAANGALDAMAPANNGEIAHFSWLQQVGNKVFAPFFSIKNGSFWTDHPDEAWIAVYSYPGMQLEKTIKDNRTSFIGRYFRNGLGVVENGDVYAFSSSVAVNENTETAVATDSKLTSTKPSAITRIKANTTEFDQNYYFNFENALPGYYITTWMYIGGNNFVAHVQPKSAKGAYTDGTELAIVNVVDKSVRKVTGLPADIKSITWNNYTPKDGKTAYFGVNLTSGIGYIYKVNAETATATQGLKVEGGTITAVQHLD